MSSCAEYFTYLGLFDEAIDYATSALQIMDFGVGRLTLTTALYGKAAELKVANRSAESAQVAAKARAFGYDANTVLHRLSWSNRKVQPLILVAMSLMPN